ncbi:hypothetical protein HanRHA438_Chr03g0099651 [Helianthus annuus]|nr:hypothetical protein HanRHA438_Chr03g0099651 [Helianthus annuus]
MFKTAVKTPPLLNQQLLIKTLPLHHLQPLLIKIHQQWIQINIVPDPFLPFLYLHFKQMLVLKKLPTDVSSDDSHLQPSPLNAIVPYKGDLIFLKYHPPN